MSNLRDELLNLVQYGELDPPIRWMNVDANIIDFIHLDETITLLTLFSRLISIEAQSYVCPRTFHVRWGFYITDTSTSSEHYQMPHTYSCHRTREEYYCQIQPKMRIRTKRIHLMYSVFYFLPRELEIVHSIDSSNLKTLLVLFPDLRRLHVEWENSRGWSIFDGTQWQQIIVNKFLHLRQ